VRQPTWAQIMQEMGLLEEKEAMEDTASAAQEPAEMQQEQQPILSTALSALSMASSQEIGPRAAMPLVGRELAEAVGPVAMAVLEEMPSAALTPGLQLALLAA
jgi:hypothetical protein